MKKLFAVIVLTLAIGLFSGCVERRLGFISPGIDDPVTIELDGHVIGETPCEVEFIHYGKREWVARSRGYEIASGIVELKAPWYQYAPFDFVAEALIPFTITDEHEVTVEIRKMSSRAEDDLLDRATEYRDKTLEGLEAPTGFEPLPDRGLPGDDPNNESQSRPEAHDGK